MEHRPIIALLYDFDKTLCTTDMQNYAFIPSLGSLFRLGNPDSRESISIQLLKLEALAGKWKRAHYDSPSCTCHIEIPLSLTGVQQAHSICTQDCVKCRTVHSCLKCHHHYVIRRQFFFEGSSAERVIPVLPIQTHHNISFVIRK